MAAPQPATCYPPALSACSLRPWLSSCWQLLASQVLLCMIHRLTWSTFILLCCSTDRQACRTAQPHPPVFRQCLLSQSDQNFWCDLLLSLCRGDALLLLLQEMGLRVIEVGPGIERTGVAVTRAVGEALQSCNLSASSAASLVLTPPPTLSSCCCAAATARAPPSMLTTCSAHSSDEGALGPLDVESRTWDVVGVACVSATVAGRRAAAAPDIF